VFREQAGQTTNQLQSVAPEYPRVAEAKRRRLQRKKKAQHTFEAILVFANLIQNAHASVVPFAAVFQSQQQVLLSRVMQ